VKRPAAPIAFLWSNMPSAVRVELEHRGTLPADDPAR
jgi:hypothetical protein